MNEPTLPDHDRDLQMARSIGRQLESGRPLSPLAAADPMMDALLQFRTAYTASQDTLLPEADVSRRLWNAIAEVTINRRPARIVMLRPAVFRFAVAASLLAAVAIGWLLMRPAATPQLLAEAGTVIVRHVLDDGSAVTLRPHSRLVVRHIEKGFSFQAVHYRLEGEAFFDVTHDEGRTFAVEAGPGLVSVLGTEFNVSTWSDEVSVFLREGRVELKNTASGQAVVLSPGQTGAVWADRVAVRDEPAAEATWLDWMNGEIVFRQAPIGDVVEELAFHYDIHIEVPPERAAETITGPIALDSLDEVLVRLDRVMSGGRFVQTGPSEYRFEAN